MRVGMPHMGNLYIPFKALFERLDIDYVIPPVNNQRTLSLGVKHSPEGLCIPFKLTLGNLIEAAELGADTLIMPGGSLSILIDSIGFLEIYFHSVNFL